MFREANKCADGLADLGRSQEVDLFFFFFFLKKIFPPSSICNIFSFDNI